LIIGYVLIVTSPTREKAVLKAVSGIKNVLEAYALFGEYDIIVKVRARDGNELGSIVIKHIRSIEGVIDTETLMGVSLRP